MTDSAAVQAKLSDPTFMHAAHMNAIRAGVPEAAAGAASFGIMGKLFTPVKAAAGGGLKGVLAGAGAEAGAQGAIGAAGEAGRQLSTTGDVGDLGQVGQAALTQAAMTPVFLGAHALLQKMTPLRRVVEQADSTGIDHAQLAAKNIAAADGEDALGQVKAMAEANVEVAAHHDAAEYEGHMQAAEAQAEAARLAGNLTLEGEGPQGLEAPVPAREMPTVPGRPATAEEAAAEKNEPGFAAREAENAPAAIPETAYGKRVLEREAAENASRESDYAKALNQKGEQTIEEAQGAEKGKEGYTSPTLGETLPPEQQAALTDVRGTSSSSGPRATRTHRRRTRTASCRAQRGGTCLYQGKRWRGR